MTAPEPGFDHVDPARPAASRRYDALLGGKDNYAADRASADQLRQELPTVDLAAQELRRFMQRTVHHLAADCGVRRFLDIGCGLPHAPNVHEIAQAVDPTSRVVYVDPDPLVGAHARALFTSHPEGATDFVLGGLADIDTVLAHDTVRTLLDLTQPVAVLLLAVLHFIPDDRQARRGIQQIAASVAPGSYLAVSHVTFDPLPAEQAERLAKLAEPGAGHGPFRARSRAEITDLLDGWDLEPPGLVSVVDWRPTERPLPRIIAAEAAAYGVVATRK
jgi:SAM-dependent methyltransferase